MTEFLPVVMVVELYWSDSMNESHFSLCGRVFCLDVWDCAASQSVKSLARLGRDPGTSCTLSDHSNHSAMESTAFKRV